MAKRKGRMPTIWEVDDELWRLIKPVIDADMPRKRTGRPPADRRKVLNCIIHRMRSGCQWNRLPKELGSDRTDTRARETVGKNSSVKPAETFNLFLQFDGLHRGLVGGLA